MIKGVHQWFRCSIGGMIILVIGLYIVLWGKHRESNKIVQSPETTREDLTIESTQESKEVNHIDITTMDIPTQNEPMSSSIATSTK